MLMGLLRRLLYRFWASHLPLKIRLMRVALIAFYRGLRLVKRRLSVIATVKDITYELDLYQKIDFEIFFLGVYSPHDTAAINMLCREGMTVIDIGANIGAFTLHFAKLVGPKGKVIAFEPMSWAFAKLERNIALNDFANITPERMALSNETRVNRVVDFRASWPLDKTSQPRDSSVSREREAVDFTTLDEYLKISQYGRIDVIKIDVDGYELKVIQGAIETLKLHKPLILLEIGPKSMAEVGDSAEDLVATLSDLGYKLHWYSPSTRKIKRYPSAERLINSIAYGEDANCILSVRDLESASSPALSTWQNIPAQQEPIEPEKETAQP
jgi:FkbM family methyltransferase